MLKSKHFKYLSSFLLLVSSLFMANFASATTELCFKKEVSPDSINWFDANTEAEAVTITDTAYYRFTAYKCDNAWGGLYNIFVTDELLNVYQQLEDLSSDQYDRTPSTLVVEAPGICSGREGTIENVASVEGWSMISDTPRYDSDNAWIRCDNIIVGGDGCTPGYWKQPQHIDSWPVAETTLFSEVFDRVITIRQKKTGDVTDPTLLQALSALGGKVNTAARHATAAYLNALNSGVNYDMNEAGVVAAFQGSYDTDTYGVLIENLVNFNEQGCPLN